MKERKIDAISSWLLGQLMTVMGLRETAGGGGKLRTCRLLRRGVAKVCELEVVELMSEVYSLS
mgnify:CR=1 FL=1